MKIRISPETELVMDPMTSVISKEKNEQRTNTGALFKHLCETERIVDAMVDSLSPGGPLTNAWRGRDNVFRTAGLITNIFFGLIAGLVVSGLILLILFVRGGGVL